MIFRKADIPEHLLSFFEEVSSGVRTHNPHPT